MSHIVPKWSLSYFQPILMANFVTIATVKVKLIPDFYTLAHCPNKLISREKKNVAFPWVETSTGPGGFMICVFII